VAPWKRSNRRRRHQFGFTLIEVLVIVLVVGILAVLSAPSFIALMDSIRVDQTIVEVRTALQSTQRQAIRGTQVCSVTLQLAPTPTNITSAASNSGNGNSGNGNGNGNGNSGNGNSGNGNGNGNAYGLSKNNGTNSISGSVSAISGAAQVTNIKNSVTGTCLTSGEPDLPSNVSMATNISGSTSASTSSTGVEIKYGVLGGAEFAIQGLNTTVTRDASGKIIAFVPERQNAKKKCIAISSTLGLTRVGTYVGNTDPDSITQTGVCTALEWNKQ
jgi:Tfp pilus assembly protein FimT